MESVALDSSESRVSQQPFTLSVHVGEAQKKSLNLVLHLQKWCSKPTWPLSFEVSTSKEEENTMPVEYYRQPFETAPSTARMRSQDILVAAQDDPDKVFKKKRKAE